MNKKIKIIISSILCVLIIGVGVFLVYNNSASFGDKKSKEFIHSINYIKDENYIEAYNIIKNSNKEEIDIIKTIILYKFINQFDISVDLDKKMSDEANHITDYLTYTYIYSKDSSYQQKIDKIYEEEFSKLFKTKNKIPEALMFDDVIKYYNLYFEYLDIDYKIFENYEYNALNDKNSLIIKFDKIKAKLNEMSEEYKKVVEIHPKSAIPEEYIYLLDI